MATDRFMSFGGDVRSVGEWRFEGGGFVQILVGGGVPTAEALEMIDTLIALKRSELAKRAESQDVLAAAEQG